MALTRVFGTKKVLEANGASIASSAIGAADDATYSCNADGADYPHAEFVLSATFGTAPTEGSLLTLVARLLDIDGTADAEAPEATRADRFICNFIVNNVTTNQKIAAFAYDVPRLANYYLLNNGTSQAVSAGWALSVTPMSYT